MVYLCTGEPRSNPCFSKGEETGQLTGGNADGEQTSADKVQEVWPKAKTELCTAKTADRNIRSTIARFWAQVRDRSSGGDKEPQFGVCVNYGGTTSDKGCLEYATTNTTDVFWMKTLLDADDALQAAETHWPQQTALWTT
ncbi:Trypanosomal VSG domain [Trypanosoma vivax]|nr:Trypanosomal VSG domain [Trypanosoma vivax]